MNRRGTNDPYAPTPEEYAEKMRTFNADVKRKLNAHDDLVGALLALVKAHDSGTYTPTFALWGNARAVLAALDEPGVGS